MATEGKTGLMKRPTVLASATGVAAAGILGVTEVGPSMIHDIGVALTAATSTGEGISGIVGGGLGIAAIGIARASDRTHSVSALTSDCGTVDPASKYTYEDDYYDTVTAYRCEHDGGRRRSVLRSIGVRTLAMGAAATLVGTVAHHMGIEPGVAAAIADAGTAAVVAGAVGTASTAHRARPAKGTLAE